MFCYQCEQTAKGSGCTKAGVCGKDDTTATLQDVLIHGQKGLSAYAHELRKMNIIDREIDIFTCEAVFSTLTNVDFDPSRFQALIEKQIELTKRADKQYREECEKAGKEPQVPECPSEWNTDIDSLLEYGRKVGIEARKEKLGDTITGLQELLTYGLKGVCAYADHAQILGKADDDVYAFIHEAFAYLLDTNPTVDDLLSYNLRCGEANLKVMALLDAANTEAYGHPEPTQVRIEPLKGKAILVSGHDLKDLEEILKQTEGKGINVYTHGEMLPANAYPGLKKYAHLAGNYGGAWQEQKKEFDEFPGAVLMTTNCIQKPSESYKGRIFTTGLVGWPGVTHITDKDFTPVIEAALAEEGFAEDGPDKTITIGFARNAVMGVAGKVVEAVKSGDIKRFFLIGGCDGAKSGRNYYTEFAKAVPDDSVILTLACGKYRFNKLDFGDIGGIPRLLDVGQCNDAYSAVQIAVALADAFDCGVNDLPLSFIVSWYEQKACAILLTLLHLGIRNIKLGPSLPAFITEDVLNVLVEKFSIAPISSVEEDLKKELSA